METKTNTAVTLNVAQGYVDQRDLHYEDHKRGSNWIASVSFDPASPSALARSFWNKGSGSFRHVPADLVVGQFIEVAFDYTSGGGNRSRKRRYYRVVKSNENVLILIEQENAPDSSSMSNADFEKEISGIRVEKSFDFTDVTNDMLIAELRKRGLEITIVQ